MKNLHNKIDSFISNCINININSLKICCYFNMTEGFHDQGLWKKLFGFRQCPGKKYVENLNVSPTII